MNIYIIHGDDEISSREYFLKLIKKQKGNEILRFRDNYPGGIGSFLKSQSLFCDKTLFVLEDLSSISKKELVWLAKNVPRLKGNLIIYEKKEIASFILKIFPQNTKFKKFDLPKLIFIFLSMIKPGNTQKVLEMLHRVVLIEPPEFVFALLASHFRDLYWAKVDPQTLLYPAWRVGKLKSQASHFSEKKLAKFIKRLAEIDLLVKTSQAQLLSSLDLMFIRELE